MGPLDLAEGHQTGRFVYDVKAGTWEWDDDVYALHGYRPGEVQVTTEPGAAAQARAGPRPGRVPAPGGDGGRRAVQHLLPDPGRR
ncbi:hypothetical protein G5V59_12420 [Nocardioides sp. W3-2-3]|uniref:hypothetical protein n=1 Tax=Nocardioides convexus TaxID=2712224 RepID=UPI00241826AB|nr:hypothetical protein [Nocardioides convexus]NHA00553.1 hypothetical protein [Nocardioides convexus]